MCLEKITFCFAECAAPRGPCAEQNSRKQPRIGPHAFSWLFSHVLLCRERPLAFSDSALVHLCEANNPRFYRGKKNGGAK